MTTPIPHGYPDWGRSISAADISILLIAQNITQVTSVIDRYSVGNLPYLFVVLFSDLQGARVQFDFYTTETGSNLIGTRTVDVIAGADAAGAIEVIGPWVEVTLRLNAQPSFVILRLFQTLVPGTHHDGLNGPSLISQDTTAVAAGATVDFTSPMTRWGHGHFNADLEGAAAYRLTLHAVDYQGNTRIVDVITNGNRGNRGMILLPPQTVRLRVLNGDAVPRNLWATVTSASIPLSG